MPTRSRPTDSSHSGSRWRHRHRSEGSGPHGGCTVADERLGAVEIGRDDGSDRVSATEAAQDGKSTSRRRWHDGFAFGEQLRIIASRGIPAPFASSALNASRRCASGRRRSPSDSATSCASIASPGAGGSRP
jgi:hypothetical protein